MPTKKRKLSKDAPYHTEHLWALIQTLSHPDDVGGTTTAMMYLLAPSRKALWASVVESEFYGTGHTKESLQALGFVAREVFVQEVPK